VGGIGSCQGVANQQRLPTTRDTILSCSFLDGSAIIIFNVHVYLT
jgi:hypothetical protein